MPRRLTRKGTVLMMDPLNLTFEVHAFDCPKRLYGSYICSCLSNLGHRIDEAKRRKKRKKKPRAKR